MSQSAILQAVLYNQETAFCENQSTFGTALPLINEVDLSGLARKKERIPHQRSYMNEEHHDQLAAYDAHKITLRGRLVGLGASCSGAVLRSDAADSSRKLPAPAEPPSFIA